VSSDPPSTSAPIPFGESEPDAAGSWRAAEEDRKAIIAQPGPSWHEWLYGQAFKWWLGIGLLIVDSWIVAGWIEVAAWVPLAVSVGIAIYLEYLLYQYLWHPYHPELRGKFRPTWKSPFEVGRWVPDRAKLLSGDVATAVPTGPDPKEFL
jgi:hypothetical protein